MSELIPISVAAIILSILSHLSSEYDPIRCRYGRQDRFWYIIMAISMILFVGLRTGYNDTGTYRLIYDSIPKDVDLWDGIDWLTLGDNPAFTFTNRVLVRLGFSTQSYLMFYATITLGIYLWFFRKYTSNLPFSIFLFVTFCGYTFTMAAIKQCLSMALCLIATDRVIHKKYIPFLLWVLLSSLYHPYALMYLAVPLLTFRPWSTTTLVIITIFAVVGSTMGRLIGTLLDVTLLLGENYDATSFTGEGVNPFRLAAITVPIFLSLLVKNQIAVKKDRVQNLIVNLAMLNGEIMFLALFGTANYFARLANYFIPFQALAIPQLLSHFNKETKKMVTICAVICYTLFFIYTNAFHDSFDYHFYSITLWEYLKSLF